MTRCSFVLIPTWQRSCHGMPDSGEEDDYVGPVKPDTARYSHFERLKPTNSPREATIIATSTM
jgi:hypothetical protein